MADVLDNNLILAVYRRVQRVGADRDLSPVLGSKALSEALRLAKYIEHDTAGLQIHLLLGLFHFYRAQALPPAQDAADYRAAVSYFTPCFIAGVNLGFLPPELLPILAKKVAPEANAMIPKLSGSADLATLSAMIELWQRIVDASPADSPASPVFKANLSSILLLRFERTGRTADLDAAIEEASAGAATVSDPEVLAFCQRNLGNSSLARFKRFGILSDWETAVQALRAAIAAIPTHHPHKPTYFAELSSALQLGFRRTGDLSGLEEAIGAAKAAIAALPSNRLERSSRQTSLGLALRARFQATGDLTDLAGAIAAAEAAISALPPDHPDKATCLSNLENVYRDRFLRIGDLADLETAVDAARAAVIATPAHHPNRAAWLENLGATMRIRFEHSGALPDLREAVDALEAAVAGTPIDDPHRASSLDHLALALRLQFENDGALSVLNKAIDVSRAAITATPAEAYDLAPRLHTLGAALVNRFERTDRLSDLEEAIGAIRTAIVATPLHHPNRPGFQDTLAKALLARFERLDTLPNLEEAIDCAKAAIAATPRDNPNQMVSHGTLGSALLARFQRTGEMADLEEAITADRAAAVAATTSLHPRLPHYQAHLGNSLTVRFERTGSLESLNEAIDVLRLCLSGTHMGSFDRASYLNNLGRAVRLRFVQTGALPDLAEAIEAFEGAVAVIPVDHPGRPAALSNLATALRAQFERTAVQTDLDRAIETGGAAVAVTPADHPARASYQNNLGNALQTRYERFGASADIEAAIAAKRAAVEATPPGHPTLAVRLSNFGLVLRLRFESSGVLSDLGEALETLRSAIASAPADGPARAICLVNLAEALVLQGDVAGSQESLEEAASSYSEAAEMTSATPSLRIMAARMAAKLAAPDDPRRAAELLESAILLLPKMAPRQLGRDDQQHAISLATGLASEAAALALADATALPVERPRKALKLLEAGRAVLLSQTLDTRSDLTDLRKQHPGLAIRFEELRGQLDNQALASTDTPDVTTAAGQPEGRRKLTEQFTSTINLIRTFEGFSSFGLPPTIDELLAEAAPGPIVAFNVSSYRSDALLVTKDDIRSIELPDLSHEALSDHARDFQHALQETISPTATPANLAAAQERLRQSLRWLWDTAAEPVLHALGYLSEHSSDTNWPKVWWVPCGYLNLLPIHAAGYHDDPPGRQRRTVIDRVISSYTPTIRALRYAREHTAADAPAERVLIVAMPITPGLHGKLNHVLDEVASVRARFPNAMVLSEYAGKAGAAAPLSETLPTKANVIARMPESEIAHFACHGATDPGNPSNSVLLLHDHATDPLTVRSLAPVNLDRVQLAYLSACRTALTSDTRLVDEAIHVSSSFQLIGFPHVIATFWEIDDALAVEVADAFYGHLRTPNGIVDTDRSAFALHRAILAIRDKYPSRPFFWAAYLHSGA